MEMPVFTIRGKNHRERGVDYGVQCKELIQGVLERYIRFFNGGLIFKQGTHIGKLG